jgi:hypothetical protein
MLVVRRLPLVPVIALIFLSSLCALAQQREEEARYRIVDGFAVHGYDADGREIAYQWYETEDEAKADKAKMEQYETTTGKFYAKVEIKPERCRIPLVRGEKAMRPPADEPPAKGAKIEVKRPTFVDPGSPRKGKGSVLSGKKGRGKLGDFKATIEFASDGTFVMSGEVTGKGRWQETDTGGVYMEPVGSTFRGNIKGTKVSGLWFMKDTSRPMTEWWIDLSSTPLEAEIDSMVGVWKQDTIINGELVNTWVHEFRKDGSATLTITTFIPSPSEPHVYDLLWRRVGEKVECRGRNGDEWRELDMESISKKMR